MNTTLDHSAIKSARYLGGLFGVETHIRPWKSAAELPMYLVQQYSWYVMDFSGKELLLALPKGETPPPSMLTKHLAAARKKHEDQLPSFFQHCSLIYDSVSLSEKFPSSCQASRYSSLM